MIKVLLGKNESLESALRRFKRICNNEGVIRQLRKNAYYEKPSERSRREDRERLKNLKRAQAFSQKFRAKAMTKRR